MTTVQATKWWNSQTGQLQRWTRRSRSDKRGTKSCRSLRNDYVAVRPALSTVIRSLCETAFLGCLSPQLLIWRRTTVWRG